MDQENQFSARHTKLFPLMKEREIDLLAFNAGPSLRYLTGLEFHISERPVVCLFAPGSLPVMILPELEVGKIDQCSFDLNVHPYSEDRTSWENVFRNAVAQFDSPIARIGVEPRHWRFLEMELLQAALPDATWIQGDVVINELRMHKDDSEITCMRKAVEIAQNAFEATLATVKLGMSEKSVASELTTQLLKHGTEGKLPFYPIVATGPNGANPHAFPTDRTLERGDLVVIDWGANVNGYFSDITRTIAIGEIELELKAIYDICYQANAAGRDIAGPDVPAQDVDRATRSVIDKAGYGEYFIHRTGHGLGMEGHELPYIVEGNTLLLKPGMTFTIEPGIYIPGRGGVRIEDDVLITDSGLESLSDLTREIITIK